MSNHIDLGALNKSSARIASFLVKIRNAKSTTYTYQSKKDGSEITAHKFEAILLGEDPSSYCLAQMKGTERQVQTAATKFLDDTVWTLSQVALDRNVQTAYVHTPVQECVDLGKSRFVPHNSDTLADITLRQKMPNAPVPPRSVAETAGIKNTRATDVIAIVKSVDRQRVNRAGHTIADVTLIDDTKATTGELATIVVSVWGEDKIQLINAHAGEPMVFFNLLVTADKGGLQINQYTNSIADIAPACTKTSALESKASTLACTTDTYLITKQWQPEYTIRDVSGFQPLSCVAFLDFTSQQMNSKMPEIVQINWMHLEEPDPLDTVTDKTESRIWYLAMARDMSGSTRLAVPQRNAFKLSSDNSIATFRAKHEAGSLNMPLFCHVRVSRTERGQSDGATQPTASSAGDSQAACYVNYTVEDVQPVSWDARNAPNASYNDVLHILNNCPKHDEGILFAYLSDLRDDPYYGFQVVYDVREGRQATYAAALISSTARSQTPEDVGTGYRVTTTGIIDIADADGTQMGDFTVTGFCTIDDILNFRLDPPRGKPSRTAVVLITKVEGKTCHVHKLEYVEPDDTDKAIKCFRKLRTLSKRIMPDLTMKKSKCMESVFNTPPSSLKRCRTLEAVPTDESLQEVPPS